MPKLSEAPLPDVRGELQALAIDCSGSGIQTLIFERRFHVGELDTLAQLIRAALLKSRSPQRRIARPGGRPNYWSMAWKEFKSTRNGSKVDTVLASLIEGTRGIWRKCRRARMPMRPSRRRVSRDLSAVLRLLRAPDAPVGSGTRTPLRRKRRVPFTERWTKRAGKRSPCSERDFSEWPARRGKNHSRICCVFLKFLCWSLSAPNSISAKYLRRPCERHL